MKNLLITGIMFLLAGQLFGQVTSEGFVQVFQDPRIDSLVEMHIKLNAAAESDMNNDGITGYRIQIFFDSGNNSKQQATDVMEDFTIKYPEIGAYITFREPWYRVRVGDFRTKIEAIGFLQKIKGKYRDAFIIRDKINFPGKNNY